MLFIFRSFVRSFVRLFVRCACVCVFAFACLSVAVSPGRRGYDQINMSGENIFLDAVLSVKIHFIIVLK